MKTVALLQTCKGAVIAVYASTEEAEARRDRYNADPFIEPGNPDTDAPYSVEEWCVTPKNDRLDDLGRAYVATILMTPPRPDTAELLRRVDEVSP